MKSTFASDQNHEPPRGRANRSEEGHVLQELPPAVETAAPEDRPTANPEAGNKVLSLKMCSTPEPHQGHDLLVSAKGQFPSRPLQMRELIQMRKQSSSEDVTILIPTVPKIEKPNPQTFFRCKGDESTWIKFKVFYPKEDFNTCYFIAPSMENALRHVSRLIRLVPCKTWEDTLFFWPLSASGFGNSWNDSARFNAGLATRDWIRMESDSDSKMYKACVSKVPRADPVWPDDKAIEDLLESAAEGKIIESEDHPAVARIFR